MAIIAVQTFDSLSEDQSLGTLNPAAPLGGDPWYTVVNTGGSLVAKATSAAHGAMGLELADMTGIGSVAWNPAQATTDTHVASMYFRINTAPTGNSYIMSVADNTGAIVTRADCRVDATLRVTIRNGTTATGGTSSESLALNTWYRAEWMFGMAGQTLRIYEGEATTPYITITGDLNEAMHNRITFGSTATSNGISLDMDTIRIADDWVGPFGTPEAPLDTPANFVFDALSDKVEIAASWDSVVGAASYEVEIEVMEGSAWSAMNTFSITGTSRTFTSADGLVGGNTYRGRVRALPGA